MRRHIYCQILVPTTFILCLGSNTNGNSLEVYLSALLLKKFLYVQNMFDFSYTLRFYAYYYIYNLLILQPICLVSMVNINNVLCPAIKDPFAGKYYRLHTLWHQLFFSVVIEKMFILLSKLSKLKSE